MSVRNLHYLLLALLSSVLMLGACASQPQSLGTAAATAEPTDVASASASPESLARPTLPPAATQGDNVVVDGMAIPALSVELSFPDGSRGVVAEVKVREGQQVKVGDPLVTLDSRYLELAVARAETELAEAQSSYDLVVEGATPEEIAEAEAMVQRAEASVQSVRGGVIEADIEAAEARLAAARLALEELRSLPKPENVAAAQANLAREQQNLALNQNTLSAEKSRTEARVQQIANDLRTAQDKYSRIYWENQALLNKYGKLTQLQIDSESLALRDVDNLKLTQEQARVEYEAARKEEIEGIALAEARVREAEANVERAQRGASPDELAYAQVNIEVAEKDLAKLRGDQRAGSLAYADADLAAAMARLAALQRGPRDSEIASAQVRIKRADLNLKIAQLALSEAVLRAPFAGTVIAINFEPGVPATSNTTLILADLSTWHVETEDISELDIAKIRVGDPAQVTVYAIPGLTLSGTVEHVWAIGQNNIQAGTHYRATIVLDELDDRLHWNMTTSVLIKPQNT